MQKVRIDEVNEAKGYVFCQLIISEFFSSPCLATEAFYNDAYAVNLVEIECRYLSHMIQNNYICNVLLITRRRWFKISLYSKNMLSDLY